MGHFALACSGAVLRPVSLLVSASAIVAVACGSRTALEVYGASDGGSSADVTSPVGANGIVQLASEPTGGRYLALDASSVYWTDGTDVLRVSKQGGPTTTLAASAGAGPIAVHNSQVYWGDSTGILTMPVSGGTATTLAALTDGPPRSIAVNDTDVYCTEGNAIIEVSVAGGPLVTVAVGNETVGVGVDTSNVYWTQEECPGCLLSQLMSEPLAGGSSSTLARNVTATDYYAFAMDAAAVYLPLDQSVLKVPLGGGPVSTLVSSENYPMAIAVDTSSVYWVELDATSNAQATSNAIGRVSIMGGSATTLASGISGHVYDLAVDSTGIYWTTLFDPGHVENLSLE
jgi:hypothetical protein